MNDLELLRRFEPVLRFTYGELFLPCDVRGYVGCCALCRTLPEGGSEEMVASGELDLERLGQLGAADGDAQLYLRFVESPLEGRELARWLIRENRPIFNARGRLARVGLGIRAIDSLVELVLLLRGRVPGGTIAAAERKYSVIRRQYPEFPYYGRVVRQGGYVVLHYLYFYAMNDWRSTFHGLNDHEGDWEQVIIYLEPVAGGYRPLWVSASVHGFPGQELRRHWDDPDLERIGDHPVIYVAAGSHANYFLPGEYLARYEVGFLKPVYDVVDSVRRFWTQRLQQGDPTELGQRIAGLLRFPYVDYARGDGASIGPGEHHCWRPVLLEPDAGWVERYRGLWGVATNDALEGQSGPGGPKYGREGAVRETWSNPVGWTGLHNVAPPGKALALLDERCKELHAELNALNTAIQSLQVLVPALGLEIAALREQGSLDVLERRSAELRDLEAELNQSVARCAEIVETIDALDRHRARLEAGVPGELRAHLRQPHIPLTSAELQESRIVETWAAVSVGLLLIGFAALVALYPESWIVAGIALAISFVAIDIALRRHITDLVVAASVALALASALVLLYEFFFQILLIVVVALSLLVIIDNFREIRGR